MERTSSARPKASASKSSTSYCRMKLEQFSPVNTAHCLEYELATRTSLHSRLRTQAEGQVPRIPLPRSLVPMRIRSPPPASYNAHRARRIRRRCVRHHAGCWAQQHHGCAAIEHFPCRCSVGLRYLWAFSPTKTPLHTPPPGYPSTGKML